MLRRNPWLVTTPPLLPLLLAALVSAGAVLLAASAAGLLSTSALFTDDVPVDANIAAGRIFRDERVTPAFSVNDRSSGSGVNGSSSTAFASDGIYFLTRAWPAAFDVERYIDFEFNDPLPADLAANSVEATLRVASDGETGSACFHAELRRASTGALLSSHGNAGNPLGCTSGTAYATLTLTLAAAGSTDIANDLRLRVFARHSDGEALRVDAMTVAGSSSYAAFTLYPVLTREMVSGSAELIPWGLAP